MNVLGLLENIGGPIHSMKDLQRNSLFILGSGYKHEEWVVEPGQEHYLTF